MSDFLMSSANFIDTYFGAIANDFNTVYEFLKPFIDIADGASKLLGMF